MNKNIIIRTEVPSDYLETENLIKTAFIGVQHASGKEWLLVKNLRSSKRFISDLSLVAVFDNQIVGHILLTPIEIESVSNQVYQSLALAPISVAPDFQGKGIGGQLINSGHAAARKLGFKSIILLGHPGYYPRFGYKKASLWNITPPFDVPAEAFMAIELEPLALKDIAGRVKYPKEFSEI